MKNDGKIFNQKKVLKDALYDILKNLSFSQKVNYHLSIINMNLNLKNERQEQENADLILQLNFLETTIQIIENNKNNEEVLRKIADIYHHLIRLLSNKSQKEFPLIKQVHYEILLKINTKFIDVIKVLIKNYKLVVSKRKENLRENIEQLHNLIEKFSNEDTNNLAQIINLFHAVISTQIENAKKDESNLINQIIAELSQILSKTNNNKVAINILSLWELFFNNDFFIENIISKNSINVILSLLNRFIKKDSILVFKLSSFLINILKREDIEFFIKILQCSNYEMYLKLLEENEGYKFNHLEKASENFENLKLNITRILFIVSKEKKFFIILKELNTVENFVSFLKRDLEFLNQSPKEKDIEEVLENSILPELNLLMALITNDKIKNQSNKVIQDTSFCLFQSLQYFKNDEIIINQILGFLIKTQRETSIPINQILSKDNFEEIFCYLITKYYLNEMIYKFLYRIPLFCYYIDLKEPEENSQEQEKSDDINSKKYNQEVTLISNAIESILIFYNDEKRESILNLLSSLSLKVIIGSKLLKEHNLGVNEMFNNNSFDISCNLILNLISHINMDSLDTFIFQTDEDFCQLITFTFCIAENNQYIEEISDDNEKAKMIIALIKKLLEGIKLFNVRNYFITRINRLIEEKDNNFLTILFKCEVFFDLIIEHLKMDSFDTSVTKEQKENFFALNLKILNIIFNLKNINLFISKFLHSFGIFTLIHLSNEFKSNWDITKHILSLLHLLTFSYFKESSIFFQNSFTLRTFIQLFIKQVKFSSKGISEKMYFKLISYLKNITKTCEIYELCEETDLIPYLHNEANDIFFFYGEQSNGTLETLFEIFKAISLNKRLLKFIFVDKLSSLISNILNQLKEKFKENNNNIFLSIAIILNAIFKSKYQARIAYIDTVWKGILKSFIAITSNKINEIKDMIHVLELIQTLILFEHTQITPEKLITKDFLDELANALNPSTVNFNILKLTIEKKCITLLDNPTPNELIETISLENNSLFQEIENMSNRREMRRGRRLNVRSQKESVNLKKLILKNNGKNEENNDDKVDVAFLLRNSSQPSISLSQNLGLQVKFESACMKIISLVDYIIEKSQLNDTIESENEELLKYFNVLGYFIKKEENIPKIVESGLIPKFILIIQNSDIFHQTVNLCFSYLCSIMEMNIAARKFIEDPKVSEYFLMQFDKINIENWSNVEMTEKEKINLLSITKIISILSLNLSFITNYRENILNEQKILSDLLNVPKNKEICFNLLLILNNISKISPSKDSILGMERKGMILMKVWNCFEKEYDIINQILETISIGYNDENFVYDLIINDFISKLFFLLKQKIDSNLILHVYSVIEIVISSKYFLSKIANKKQFGIMLEIAEQNSFNSKIIDKFLSLTNKMLKSEKKYIEIFDENRINSFLIEVLTKYMVTCQSNLFILSLELIVLLINTEKYFIFYSKKENIEILIKVFRANMKTKDQVLSSLKLFNQLSKIQSNYLKNSTCYDFTENYTYDSLCDIITDIFINFGDYFEVISELCTLISSLFYMSPRDDIKQALLLSIIQGGTNAVKKKQINQIDLFLKNILEVIKKVKNRTKYLDGSSLIYFINEIFKQMKINSQMLMQILDILKSVVRDNALRKNLNLNEIFKCLSNIPKDTQFHVDAIINSYSKILSIIFETSKIFNQTPSHFIIFLLKYLADNITQSQSNSINLSILYNIKSIATYSRLEKQDEIDACANYINKLFQFYKDNTETKYIIYIFQIISSLTIQSQGLKYALNSTENNICISKDIEKLLNGKVFKEPLVEYQAKGCLLNLKIKDTTINSSIGHETSILYHHLNLLESSSKIIKSMDLSLQENKIDSQMFNFLIMERKVKLYQVTGNVQNLWIKMFSLSDKKNLDVIKAYNMDKDKIEVIEEMRVEEMESCVRSASTAPFKKAKGFFTKKPNPARCFSILGVKNFNKDIKSFNVECDDETTCIKYVDYISSLINNNRLSKEEK